MAKKKSAAYMTPGEQIAGTVFLALYLLVPFSAAGPVFTFAGRLLGGSVSPHLQSILLACLPAAAALVIFHSFLARTTGNLADSPAEAGKAALWGLIALYGLNELAFRLTRLALGAQTNLNDAILSPQSRSLSSGTALLTAVLITPFVEEILFRGLVFGNLRSRSRVLAYTVSCLLFALLQARQTLLTQQNAASLALVLQSMVPGLVLAGVYEYAGTLWAAVGLHAAFNALARLL